MTIEKTILTNLIKSEDYTRKVLPYLKLDYFDTDLDKYMYILLKGYIEKYNDMPEPRALEVNIEQDDIPESLFKDAIKFVRTLEEANTNEQWLLDQTEEFCQDKAIYNAIHKSIKILDGDEAKLGKGSIPELLSDAISVSFDNRIGHDYFEDFESRFEYYHRQEEKIDFDIDILSEITKGGVSKKTLSIFMAPTGVGKTIVMCHCAGANMMHGEKVLYITMEMAEEQITRRIDANLMDITLDRLDEMDEESYHNRIQRIRKRTGGDLVVKEYPTSSASASHFRFLLKELEIKKNFKPDIVYIDYINICMSSRRADPTNSYGYVKAIAEEIRGLAVEFNIPIVSATQTNRDGMDNSDIDLTNTSESIGLPQTVDFMLALMTNEEFEASGRILCKQLKNRWNAIDNPRKFVIGVDKSKMKLYNIRQSDFTPDSGPVMGNTQFGERQEEEDSNGIRRKGKQRRVNI